MFIIVIIISIITAILIVIRQRNESFSVCKFVEVRPAIMQKSASVNLYMIDFAEGFNLAYFTFIGS